MSEPEVAGISNELRLELNFRRRKVIELEEFLKVFGNWVVEIKSSKGEIKELKVKELYEIFNQSKAKHKIENWCKPFDLKVKVLSDRLKGFECGK